MSPPFPSLFPPLLAAGRKLHSNGSLQVKLENPNDKLQQMRCNATPACTNAQIAVAQLKSVFMSLTTSYTVAAEYLSLAGSFLTSGVSVLQQVARSGD